MANGCRFVFIVSLVRFILRFGVRAEQVAEFIVRYLPSHGGHSFSHCQAEVWANFFDQDPNFLQTLDSRFFSSGLYLTGHRAQICSERNNRKVKAKGHEKLEVCGPQISSILYASALPIFSTIWTLWRAWYLMKHPDMVQKFRKPFQFIRLML